MEKLNDVEKMAKLIDYIHKDDPLILDGKPLVMEEVVEKWNKKYGRIPPKRSIDWPRWIFLILLLGFGFWAFFL